MSTVTIFHGLFQGEHDSTEDATLIGMFSTPEKATKFEGLIRDQLQRETDWQADDVPNLYWDIRPVAFDPRSLKELL